MSVIKFLRDWTDLFNWSTDENPTTQQDYQNAVKNWVATETSIVDALLWQPETVYAVGNQVKTPSLPSEHVLVCTVAGTSGANEPDYTNVSVGSTVTDGTVTWMVVQLVTSAGIFSTESASYIRFVSGLQLCWGMVTSVVSSGKSVTFPVSFNATPVIVLGTTASSHCWYTGGSSTGFSARSAASSATVLYVAIGKWK